MKPYLHKSRLATPHWCCGFSNAILLVLLRDELLTVEYREAIYKVGCYACLILTWTEAKCCCVVYKWSNNTQWAKGQILLSIFSVNEIQVMHIGTCVVCNIHIYLTMRNAKKDNKSVLQFVTALR